MPIKLVVGLGNPGKAYAATRHNIGRRVVESLEDAGLVGVALFIPEVFMNTSGVPVAQLVRKKGIAPGEILVISDDFELPLGSIRIRLKGSAGGHNGLKSIFENVGTQEVPRLRLGIGPVPLEQDPADFVLKPFAARERSEVRQVIEQAAEAVRVVVAEGLESAMNRFNRRAA